MYAPRTAAIAPLAPMFDARVRRGAGRQGHDGLRGRRSQAAGEVPEQEANLAERVLDVVAEDPQEEHVEADVRPAGVHEHRREDAPVPRDLRLERVADAGAVELAGVVAVVDDVGIDGCAGDLPEPHEHVDHDDPDCDDRERPRRDVVAKREHVGFLPHH